MVLGFMTKFPWGEPTNFFQKIIAGVYDPNNPQAKPGNLFRHNFQPKLHTIREGQRWKPGTVVHMATGVRTKNYYQFNKDIPELQTIKGVQRIDIIIRSRGAVCVFIDKKCFYARYTWQDPAEKDRVKVEKGREWFLQFLQNDGLTEEQFLRYFKEPLRNGQLLHFTDLKY